MGIKGKCTQCGEGFNKKEENLGKEVKCKACGNTFVLATENGGESRKPDEGKPPEESGKQLDPKILVLVGCGLLAVLGIVAVIVISLVLVIFSGQKKYDGKTVEEWIELLDHRGSSVRKEAVRKLSSIGKPAIPRLIAELKGDKSDHFKRRVAQAIGGSYGSAEPYVDDLIDLFEDEDRAAGDFAAQALVKLGKHAVPGLIDALDARSLVKRASSIVALDDIAAHGFVNEDMKVALQRVMEKDENSEVRGMARQALGSVLRAEARKRR